MEYQGVKMDAIEAALTYCRSEDYTLCVLKSSRIARHGSYSTEVWVTLQGVDHLPLRPTKTYTALIPGAATTKWAL